MIGRHPSTSAADLMCQFLYRCLGLHSGFPKKRRFQRVTFVAWVLVHLAGFWSICVYWQGQLSDSGTRSLSDFSIFGHDCIFIGAVVFVNFKIMLNHDEIESLVRRNGRGTGELFLQLMYGLPFALVCLRRGLTEPDAGIELKEAYFALLEFSAAVFFLACSDMILNLKTIHEDILALASNTDANQDEILTLKWKSRDCLRRINELFSRIWGAYAMLMYSTAVFVVVEMVCGRLSLFDKTVTLSGDIFSSFRLYRLAEGSSSLKDSCLKVERMILSKYQKNEIRRDTSKKLLPTMAYREDWDILLSGCFHLESRGFLSFLATSVTCMAVVLQFDYHILQNLQEVTAKTSAT